MSRNRRRSGSASPQPPPSLILPSPLTLKFEPDASLQVTVKSPQKPESELDPNLLILAAAFTAGVLIWMLFFWSFVLDRGYSPSIAITGTPLVAVISHPARVAFGDEAEMELIVHNRGAADFTGAVTVIFEGDVEAHPLPNETTTVRIENLGSGASRSYRLKFSLGPKSGTFSGGIVRASLQSLSSGNPVRSLNHAEIGIARLSYARSLVIWIRNSAIAIAVAALLWEVARKRLFRWEEK